LGFIVVIMNDKRPRNDVHQVDAIKEQASHEAPHDHQTSKFGKRPDHFGEKKTVEGATPRHFMNDNTQIGSWCQYVPL
jgi:hypothetical protein